MKRRILSVIMSLALVIAMMPGLECVSYAEEGSEFTLTVGLDNPAESETYTLKAGEEASGLPEGLSWDGTGLTMDNYSGTYINVSSDTQVDSFSITLAGENTLTGGVSGNDYTALKFVKVTNPVLCGSGNDYTALKFVKVTNPVLCGSGTLNVNVDITGNTGRVVAVWGGYDGRGGIQTKDSCTLNVNVHSAAETYAFYTWNLKLYDSSNVYVNCNSDKEKSNIFCTGGIEMYSSGNCVFKSNGEYANGGFDYYVGGQGSLTCYKSGSDRDPFTNGRYIRVASNHTYVIHGNGSSKTQFSAVLSVQESTREAAAVNPTVKTVPVEAPQAGKKAPKFIEVKDNSGNVEYAGDIRWYVKTDGEWVQDSSLSAFAEYAEYKAEIVLASMPGYSFKDMGEDAFTIDGGDCSFDSDTATVTATFAETGESVIPGIGTELAVKKPVAGNSSTSSNYITGKGYTGSVKYNDLTAGMKGISSFQYARYYEAEITLDVKDGYSVSKLTADDFTVAGLESDEYSIEYTRGSNVVKVKFLEPTEFRYSVYIGTEHLYLPQDESKLPEGITFERDDVEGIFTLENYNGPAIVSDVPCTRLNLYLKGENNITPALSKVITSSQAYIGIGAYNGDINIRGDEDASLNICLDVTEDWISYKYGITTNGNK